MPRYRLTIEYDGTPFVGWQVQDSGPSVQGRLADAVEAFCGQRYVPRGAGRTDTGVHALGQVAHIDLSDSWPPGTIRDALNHHLKPDPIVVLESASVSDDFDARFSATARHYVYRILPRRTPPALDRNRVWHVMVPLDAEAMHEAAQRLIGTHDFSTFRASQCQAASPVKSLDRLDVSRVGQEIQVRASARSFLHTQVRSMVGSLKRVGEGKWATGEVYRALKARDRSACGPLAPPHGLYLERVDY